MTPEVALLIRAVFISLAVLGLERLSRRRTGMRAAPGRSVIHLQSATVNPLRTVRAEAERGSRTLKPSFYPPRVVVRLEPRVRGSVDSFGYPRVEEKSLSDAQAAAREMFEKRAA